MHHQTDLLHQRNVIAGSLTDTYRVENSVISLKLLFIMVKINTRYCDLLYFKNLNTLRTYINSLFRFILIFFGSSIFEIYEVYCYI